MADATTAPVAPAETPKAMNQSPKVATTQKARAPSRFQQLNKLYALPAPLRTFPLPTFVPHNPLSLFHILYVWVSQTIHPEPSHINPLHQGWFSPETRSVHVTDTRSIRGLWEQGFYGKGTLSRSEPSWHNREKTRLGSKTKQTSEEFTRERRAARQTMKWERARKEREAIDLKLMEEAEATSKLEDKSIELELPMEAIIVDPVDPAKEAESMPVYLDSQRLVAPVGPLELLALPNSQVDMDSLMGSTPKYIHEQIVATIYSPPVGPLELLALPNSIKSFFPHSSSALGSRDTNPVTFQSRPDAHTEADARLTVITAPEQKPLKDQDATNAPKVNGVSSEDTEVVGGSETNDETAEGSVHSEQTSGTTDTGVTCMNGSPTTPKIKRQKSVRFSPTVEKNTFIQSEPPSPEHAAVSATTAEEPLVIKNQEHAQLTLQEAFFLSYALGALTVLSPTTNLPIPNEDLFYLSRKTSHFPPQANPSLSPDDPFVIQYVVYHHFRSLGWTPRPGVKFSVDYLLYTRGPVFTHAEFAILILPSYTDPYWRSSPFLENYVKKKEQRTWAWLSCINRVITQAKKTLVLTYVDVPTPLDLQHERELGIDGVLGRYKVRELIMKRFSANRMRD